MPPFPLPFLQAAAMVDADATTPDFTSQRGFSLLTRDDAGEYTLTLDQPIDATESVVLASLMESDGTDPSSIEVARPDDNTVTVTTKVAGAGTDLDFSLLVLPLNNA